MNEIYLCKPSLAFASELDAYRREMLAAGSSFDGCSRLEDYDNVTQWLDRVTKCEEPANCPPDKVPSNSYLAVRRADGRVVGIMDLRHHIDHPVLRVWGGHIGYSVRPSERGIGYGKEMLRQLLPVCKARGLDRVLLTCHTDNPASAHIILANGGVPENIVTVDGQDIQRYWISL